MANGKLWKSYGETDFITGLRAFAALAVVLIHSGGAGLRELGEVGNRAADFGRTGVYAFFVISGFSVATAYQGSPNFLWFLKKRLFRILPLYYFWIIAAISLGLTDTGWQKYFNSPVDLYNLLLHFSFLSFLDYRITNTILGVEWSIPIEIFWYLATPCLVWATRNSSMAWKSTAFALLTYLIFARIISDGLGEFVQYPALFLQWNPITYFFSFILGAAAFNLRTLFQPSKTQSELAIITCIAASSIYIFVPKFILWIFFDAELVFVSVLTFVLVVFGTSKSVLYRMIFTNRLAMLLGLFSYGIYLSHTTVMRLLKTIPNIKDLPAVGFFALLTVATVIVSGVTHFMIEKPGQNLAAGNSIFRILGIGKQKSSPNE